MASTLFTPAASKVLVAASRVAPVVETSSISKTRALTNRLALTGKNTSYQDAFAQYAHARNYIDIIMAINPDAARLEKSGILERNGCC